MVRILRFLCTPPLSRRNHDHYLESAGIQFSRNVNMSRGGCLGSTIRNRCPSAVTSYWDEPSQMFETRRFLCERLW